MMRMMCGLLLAGLLAGCESGTPPETRAGVVVPVMREYKGQQAPFPDRQFLVVQRPEAWAALWEGRQAPAVDFTQQTVLGVAMGQQPTAGYGVAISDVRATGQEIVAYVNEQRPQPSDVVAQVVTYPYDFVVVPKLTQPVSFTIVGSTEQPIVLQDEFQGLNARGTAAQTAVMRNEAAWRLFWTNNISAAAEPPAIDFTRYMAVAVLIGTRPTGGYAVRIVAVTPEVDRLAVLYRLTVPATGQAVSPAATSPYAVALVPVSPQAVAFRQLPAVTVVAAAPATP
jgi:hypothetical protein